MDTELLFSMDADTSAPLVVGSYLVPNEDRWHVRWIDRDGDVFLSMTVPTSVAEDMKPKICRIHPSVRFVAARAAGSAIA